MRDIPISNTLYWGAVSLMAIIFVATVILNSYLFMLDNQLMQNVNLSRIEANKVRLILQYDSQNKRIFEGDVVGGALSLYDALILSADAGNLKIEFSKNANGQISLSKIDNLFNENFHYWELRIPAVNWSRRLNDPSIDLNKIFLTGGTTVYLIYR